MENNLKVIQIKGGKGRFAYAVENSDNGQRLYAGSATEAAWIKKMLEKPSNKR